MASLVRRVYIWHHTRTTPVPSTISHPPIPFASLVSQYRQTDDMTRAHELKKERGYIRRIFYEIEFLWNERKKAVGKNYVKMYNLFNFFEINISRRKIEKILILII